MCCLLNTTFLDFRVIKSTKPIFKLLWAAFCNHWRRRSLTEVMMKLLYVFLTQYVVRLIKLSYFYLDFLYEFKSTLHVGHLHWSLVNSDSRETICLYWREINNLIDDSELDKKRVESNPKPRNITGNSSKCYKE